MVYSFMTGYWALWNLGTTRALEAEKARLDHVVPRLPACPSEVRNMVG